MFLFIVRGSVHPGKEEEFAQKWKDCRGASIRGKPELEQAYLSADCTTGVVLNVVLWNTKPDETGAERNPLMHPFSLLFKEVTMFRNRLFKGALVLALLPCVLPFVACGSTTSQTARSTPPPTATPTSLPSAGKISATISGLGANTQFDNGIVASDTTVWVHNGAAGTLLRINPSTNTIVATIPVGHGEGGVALSEGAVWVANPVEGTVLRVDPRTNQVVATITLGSEEAVQVITVSPGAVWVPEFDEGTLVRIDPQTNRVVTTIPNQAGITGVSFGAGSVWTCNHHDPVEGLNQLNPQTNQIQAQIAVGSKTTACSSVVALAQAVWTTSHNNAGTTLTLKHIDPATHKVIATIPVPLAFPFHFAANKQGVWLYSDIGVYRVDPTTNQLSGMLDLSDTPGINGLALGANSVWVSKPDGTLLRITPA